MPRERISAARAKAHFSELISRVALGHEPIVIERRGRPVAALVNIDDLDRFVGPPDVGADGGLAFLGLWGDILTDEEITTFVDDVYSARERDLGRPVDLEP